MPQNTQELNFFFFTYKLICLIPFRKMFNLGKINGICILRPISSTDQIDKHFKIFIKLARGQILTHTMKHQLGSSAQRFFLWGCNVSYKIEYQIKMLNERFLKRLVILLIIIREPLKHTLHVAGWRTQPKLLHKS